MRFHQLTGRRAVVCYAAVFALFASPVFGKKPEKFAKDLRSGFGSAPVDVIVQFKASTRSSVAHDKVKGKGGALKLDLNGAINGSLYSIPANALDDLSDDPDVEHMSPDRPLYPTLEFATPAVGGTTARSYGYTGKGVGIAIIDSGISDSGDIKDTAGKSRVVYQEGFGTGGKTVDVYGHGGPVATAAAGNGSESSGKFTGIAPEATLINLRVLSDQGQGSDSAVIAAIDKAIQLKGAYNIRVMNLSLGRPVMESYKTDPLCQAVERAWKAGIVVVVAAGNQGRNNSAGTAGYATITSPANDPLVIAVGALRDMGTASRLDDVIASYSSKGPTLLDHVVKPDLVAPGNRIVANQGKGGHILAQNFPANKVTGTYFSLSGTSLAAPLVSGSAALLLQKTSSLTPDQVKARLMRTATKSFPATATATDPNTGVVYTMQHDMFTVGAGYVDVWAALNDNTVFPAMLGSAASPTATFDTGTKSVYVQNTTNPAWASSGVWGSNIIWGGDDVWGYSVWAGDPNLWGTSAVWGSNAIWSTSTTSGFNIIWGSNIIWGGDEQPATESTPVTIQGDR